MNVDDISQALANLKVEELNPLSPEVIERQATINIGMTFDDESWLIWV